MATFSLLPRTPSFVEQLSRAEKSGKRPPDTIADTIWIPFRIPSGVSFLT